MTLLIATIAAPTPEQAAADLASAAGRADAVELRVDHLADSEDVLIRSLAAARPAGLPLILTIRAADEGGAWDANDQERLARLIALGPIADFIDVEFATWQRSANIRQKVGLALREGGREPPARLILSAHDFRGRPAKLLALLAEMYDAGAEVVKIAWQARTVRDNFEAVDLLRAAPQPTIALCMGAAGLPSRVLARKFAAWGTYAAIEAERAAAPGQLTLDQLRHRYRWDTIGPRTRLFGVIGQPVAHSLSPAVHNAAFDALDLDAVYLPLPVEPGYESFKAFMVEALARPWLDVGGLSITLPHKENALRFVHEVGGTCDALAVRIGAVNTLKLDADGRLSATNTDGPAALGVIAGALARPDRNLSGVTCMVLGAGGVARAIVAVLREAGAVIRISNRSRDRAVQLAAEFDCPQAVDWEDRAKHPCDLLVNCTSVGLDQPDDTPFPSEGLRPTMRVMDTIYRPRQTRLLRDAAAAGCECIDGLAMFLDQAARQFEIWSGKAAPLDVMTAAAEAELLPPEKSGN